MTAIVNEQTSYFLKTGGFDYIECSHYIMATHRDSKLTVRIENGDMPTDIVNKLIREASKQILFERALNLVCNEWGYTRERALVWLGDNEQWQDPLTWPTDKLLENVAGVMPFVQVTRTSIVNPPGDA